VTKPANKRLEKLMGSTKSETEQKMIKLTVERICADMADFYRGFYSNEGPGAIIYVPMADADDSMFYLTVECLMNALNDFNNRDMEGPADVMKKAIAIAEAIDPGKESLFIIQDEAQMSLIRFKHDNPENNLLRL